MQERKDDYDALVIGTLFGVLLIGLAVTLAGIGG